MRMDIQDILNYRITSYKKGLFCTIFGVPQEIQDEGSIFRIADMYLIDKYGIEDLSFEEQNEDQRTITIRYKTGIVVELGVIA